jgi:hypothetical protein
MRRGYDDAETGGSESNDGGEYACWGVLGDAEDAGGGMEREGVDGIELVGSGVARERGETGESGIPAEVLGAIRAARRSAAASAASLTDNSAVDDVAIVVGASAGGTVGVVAAVVTTVGVGVGPILDRMFASRSSRFGLELGPNATVLPRPPLVGYAPYAIPA